MFPQRTSGRRLIAPSPRLPRNRKHLHLIDPSDGAEILTDRRVYAQKQLTPWKVELVTDDPMHTEYQAGFRAVVAEDQEYIAFTLTLPSNNLYPVRLAIYPNNEVAYESHIPIAIHVQPRKKTITMRLLARVEAVADGVAVTYLR